MFTLLYHFLWTVLFVLCTPIVLLLRNRRLLERLALDLPSTPLGEDNIWIHALSVGEVISSLPLVKALREKYPEKGMVITVTTEKGMAVAQEEFGGDVKALITLPIDFWFCVRRIVSRIKPCVFILVETDIWPALIGYLKKKKIKTILVNGRVSPNTFKYYCRLPYIARRIFEPLELCLMQSELDTERLLMASVCSPMKIITVGNVKFDRDWKEMEKDEHEGWLRRLGLDHQDTVWVAGSTHPGEEEILLDVHKKLCLSISSLRLIIAPRNIDQSTEILKRGQRMGLKTILRSEISENREYYEVLVLNTIGELGRVYGLSKVGFVGGSLLPFGGHNLLEPASFGCPVVFGNHTHNFVIMSELLVKSGGGLRVNNGKELYEAVKMLLSDDEMRNRMGTQAKEFVMKNQGALDRIINYIDRCIAQARGFH